MQAIISGTTTERTVRAALLVVFVGAFAVWYLWDGYVGYARENARQLATSLGMDPDPVPGINPELTTAEADRLIEALAKRTRPSAVTDLLGEPTLRHGDDAYYLGPGGYLRVHIENGRVAGAGWTDGPHTETDQAIQRLLGDILGVFTVLFVFHLVRVVTTRVSLTDEGLKVRGRPCIPFSAMTAVRGRKGGRVELECSIGARKGVVRLDDYQVKELASIVATICERMGFPNPHAPANADSGNNAPNASADDRTV